jgi:hypothetical protein
MFCGTHPDYTGPSLPEDKASLADVEFDSKDEDEDDDDDELVVKLVKVNIHVMVMDAMQDEEGDPKTLHEVKARMDWPCWKEAMDREIAMLDQARTWITVPHLEGKNIVGSKWVFRIKCKADGSIKKYKARLVACGFTQVFGKTTMTPSLQWPSCKVFEPSLCWLHVSTGKLNHLTSLVLI